MSDLLQQVQPCGCGPTKFCRTCDRERWIRREVGQCEFGECDLPQHRPTRIPQVRLDVGITMAPQQLPQRNRGLVRNHMNQELEDREVARIRIDAWRDATGAIIKAVRWYRVAGWTLEQAESALREHWELEERSRPSRG